MIFASGSHRDFGFPFWFDPREDDCSERYEVFSEEEMEAGDCTFHHGWTLHSAPGNGADETRYAYSVSFIADGAHTLEKDISDKLMNDEDKQSYAHWIEDVGWGNYADHPSLPIVYSEDGEEVEE